MLLNRWWIKSTSVFFTDRFSKRTKYASVLVATVWSSWTSSSRLVWVLRPGQMQRGFSVYRLCPGFLLCPIGLKVSFDQSADGMYRFNAFFTSYLWSRIVADENSRLWFLVYINWATSCARQLLWNAYECEHFWNFLPSSCKRIKVLNTTLLFGGSSDANELSFLVPVTEFSGWSKVPIVNNCRLKVWRCVPSHPFKRLEMTGDFVK